MATTGVPPRFAIIADDCLAYIHLARDDQEPAGPYVKAALTTATTHAAQIAEMIRAIRDDGTPILDGIGARHAVAIILGIHVSARTCWEVVPA